MKMFKFFKLNLHWFILILLIISTSWSLFYYHGLGVGHDLNHEARIFEMFKGLKDGAFPVIWSENLSYGYGMPLFEFYAPLPYFIGAIFYSVGFSLSQSVEAIILMANFLTLIGSYLLAKELFKNKWAAVLVAATIMLAPYRAVDLFVRSAISEVWAIAFLAYVLLGIVLIVKNKKAGIPTLVISFACLVLSHNLTALMSSPFIVIFAIFYLLNNIGFNARALNMFFKLFFTGILSLGLSSFYFMPALIEKNFTKINEFTLSSYYDFHQHFLYIRQFLNPWGSWEYGGSGWGPNDEMSYFLGYGQLFILVLGIFQACWFIIKFKQTKNKQSLIFQISLLFLIGLSLFLTLLKAQKIWELFSFTAYFQFPWRLLSVSLIFIGLLAGNLYSFFNKRYKGIFFLVIFLLLIVINPRYFRSEKYEDHSAYYNNYAMRIRNETSNNLYDYVPINVNFFNKIGFYLYKNPDYTSLTVPPISIFNNGLISKYKANIIIDKSTKKVFSISLSEDESIVLNIAYYPGWTVKDGNKEINVTPNENGLISFNLSSGDHKIFLELKDTPIRFWSKVISSISLLILFIIIFFHSKNSPLSIIPNCGRTRLAKSV